MVPSYNGPLGTLSDTFGTGTRWGVCVFVKGVLNAALSQLTANIDRDS